MLTDNYLVHVIRKTGIFGVVRECVFLCAQTYKLMYLGRNMCYGKHE